jgi:hypothetical protein
MGVKGIRAVRVLKGEKGEKKGGGEKIPTVNDNPTRHTSLNM